MFLQIVQITTAFWKLENFFPTDQKKSYRPNDNTIYVFIIFSITILFVRLMQWSKKVLHLPLKYSEVVESHLKVIESFLKQVPQNS